MKSILFLWPAILLVKIGQVWLYDSPFNVYAPFHGLI